MIDLLDEALREFLIRELPVRDNEIDISFEQPRREWSARLSRPALNLFLRDIRENVRLRSPQPGANQSVNGNTALLQRQPVRVDLQYMATAWAKDPLDEHRILSRLLAVLFRLRAVPDDLLAEHVPGQEAGVPLKLAAGEVSATVASDLWSVLDNEMRPAVEFTATLAIHPFADVTLPLVREIDIRYKLLTPVLVAAAPPPAAKKGQGAPAAESGETPDSPSQPAAGSPGELPASAPGGKKKRGKSGG